MGLMYRRYAVIPVENGWRIWDVRLDRWVGKFGEADPDYYAERREVAESQREAEERMRRHLVRHASTLEVVRA